MTCTESNQRHRVLQQDHNMTKLMLAVEEDSEDEAVEEALAVAVDRLLVQLWICRT